jgi:phage terminase Nu1 subunit (DNA packaging protein)
MERNVQYLNIQDVADKYLVTTKTIRNWIKKGLPCLKVGNILRFDIIDVDNWLRKAGD